MGYVGLGLQCTNLLTDSVILNETDTIFILDLESHVVSQEDHDTYDRINKNNKIYMEVRATFEFDKLHVLHSEIKSKILRSLISF